MPHIQDPSSSLREHAVLQAVEVLPMDWGHKFSGDEAEENPR